MVQVQSKAAQIPSPTLRRRITVGECQRKVAFSGIYALMLILAVIFAPHLYMKFAFAASGLVRLLALRREYDLLRRVGRGEIVEVVTRVQNPSTIASIVAVALVTTFALCCTALSIAALVSVGNGHDVAAFFLVANLIVWGFTACIWRAAYRSARLPATDSQARLSKSAVLEAVLELDGTENSAAKDVVASAAAPATSRHWWTDTQIREEVKVTAQR